MRRALFTGVLPVVTALAALATGALAQQRSRSAPGARASRTGP
jgi:hypothetical protein